jgi:hypothetical protein
MADFNPQTGQIIFQAAQSLLASRARQRKLDVEAEQLAEQQKRQSKVDQLRERELQVRENTLKLQQEQFQASQAKVAAAGDEQTLELEKKRLDVIKLRGDILDNLMGEDEKRKALSFDNSSTFGDTARRFEVESMVAQNPVVSTGGGVGAAGKEINIVERVRDFSQRGLQVQSRALQSEIGRLQASNVIDPVQRGQVQSQIGDLTDTLSAVNHVLDIHNEVSKQPLSAGSKQLAAQFHSIDPTMVDAVEQRQAEAVTAEQALFGAVDSVNVTLGVADALRGNPRPIINLSTPIVLKNGQVQRNELGKLGIFLRTKGVQGETIDQVLDHFLGFVQ